MARLPQSERSRRTRAKIMKATLDCILEIGVRASTTTNIAARAGISRGALMHHYPTKEALMHAALEDLLEREVATVGQLATDISAGTMDFDTFLATLCDHFTGDLFMVTLEYLTAARSDPSIKNVLLPLAYRFNEALEQIWDQLVSYDRGDNGTKRTAINATLCMFRGMGAQSVWRNDPALYRDMLLFWKQALTDMGFISRDQPLGPTADATKKI